MNTNPTRIYKYQRFADYPIDNLKKRVIWFSKPANLNDPFDCSIPFRIVNPSDDDLEKAYIRITKEMRKAKRFILLRNIENKYLTNGKLDVNAWRKYYVDSYSKDSLNETILELSSKYGVACFTTENNNILMWSHYADSHKGFCLEFNVNYFPLNQKTKIHEVIYSERYPAFDPAKPLVNSGLNLPVEGLITKSTVWQYEKEWRVITDIGDIGLTYKPQALTAIYLGNKMPESQIDEIKSTVSESYNATKINIYTMELSKTRFEVEPKLLN